MRRCVDCGHPVGNKALFCPRCGAKQPREPKHFYFFGAVHGYARLSAAIASAEACRRTFSGRS